MRKTLAILALLVTPALAQAKTFKLGDEKPVAEITVPDVGWTAAATDGLVEATASDGDAYVAADVYEAADILEAGRDTARFLLEQKVKLDPKTRTQKATTVAGLPAVETSWTGTDEDGPTRFRIWFVKLRPGKLALLTYWRSEAGETAHGADVETILKSLKPIQ